MNYMTGLCIGCPFDNPDEETKARADAGYWIPCLKTTIPRPDSLNARITAWRNEEECKGARAWRSTKAMRA